MRVAAAVSLLVVLFAISPATARPLNEELPFVDHHALRGSTANGANTRPAPSTAGATLLSNRHLLQAATADSETDLGLQAATSVPANRAQPRAGPRPTPPPPRVQRLRVAPIKRTVFRGPRGAKPLAISSRDGGAPLLQARGFSFATRPATATTQAVADPSAARLPAPAAAAAGTAAAAAAAGEVERLPTGAGEAVVHPSVLRPAPAFPATATWLDGSATAYQANPDLPTEIWLPVGVTAVGVHALGQGLALNLCNVSITITAFTYESPQTPVALAQRVDSCSGESPSSVGAFFGFAVADPATDELVRLVVEVTRGVTAASGELAPSAGVIFSDLMTSTSRPSSPAVLDINQDALYLSDVLGYDPLFPAQLPALGTSTRNIPTQLGRITTNRAVNIQAPPSAWPSSEQSVLTSAGAAPLILNLPAGTTAVHLTVGALGACQMVAGASVKIRVRAYTLVGPAQSNSVKEEGLLSAACQVGRAGAVAVRSVGFYMDGSVAGDTIRRLEVTVWASPGVAASSVPVVLSDIKVSKAVQATGDLLRLVPPPMEGSYSQVQVLRQSRWGSICGHDWSDLAAAVVCRQAGFNGGSALRFQGSMDGAPIWLRNTTCRGNETSLSDCSFNVIDQNDVPSECSHDSDAWVVCSNDEMMGFVDESYDPDFLSSQLGFDITKPKLPAGAAGPGLAAPQLLSLPTPAGRLNLSEPVTPSELPAAFKFPDGSSEVLQLKDRPSSPSSTAEAVDSDWLTLSFPVGTKAFGLYLAPDACTAGPQGEGGLTVLLSFEASVALRNTTYNGDTLGFMPSCSSEGGGAAGATVIGSYIGMYVNNPVLDSITQFRIKMPRYQDGTRVPLLLGGIQLSNYHVLQDSYSNPSASIAATAAAAASPSPLAAFQARVKQAKALHAATAAATKAVKAANAVTILPAQTLKPLMEVAAATATTTAPGTATAVPQAGNKDALTADAAAAAVVTLNAPGPLDGPSAWNSPATASVGATSGGNVQVPLPGR